MIYPANFEIKSGFATIRDFLHQRCLVNYSHELVDSISFSNDFNKLNQLHGQSAEMKYVLQFVPGFPQHDYYDLSEELIRIRVKGTFMEPETMGALKLSLEAIINIINFIQALDPVKFIELRKILPSTQPNTDIIKRVGIIINEKGEIRDNASERLASIRKEIKSRLSSIDRRINQILGQARKDNIISDEAELTIRNGRLVLPIPASNKRKLKGYVHDTSATGQTVFLEPAEVFEMNNEIQNFKVEEKQEIINILTSFADYIRPHIEILLDFYSFLGEIDFIRVKAILAIDLQANKPELNDDTVTEWRSAVHPLLQKSLLKQGKSIVAQDINLDRENRIMVISGPNAGGKSVCLKTVALLQYMLQCGLLIPVSEDSKAGIYSKIFLEIGDEQSLENDLSTYSSHLIHIKYFLEHADHKTLFLIDEFGAGTEPQLGGAMAEASLQKLNSIGSFGVITTHYTNLKLLAGESEGLFNAAMLYDTRAMQPLFKLNIGKPGSSFAFEIANKIGFPNEVVKNAASKIGNSQLDFEKQLAQLDVDKKQIAKKIAELKVADETLAELVNKYNNLLSDLEAKKNAVLKEAKSKAQQIVADSNKLIEKTIRDIKEKKAEKDITKQLREDYQKSVTDLLDNEKESPTQLIEISKTNTGEEKSLLMRKGTYVKMEGQETIGMIEEIRGTKALVWFGSLKIRTTLDKLITATSSEVKAYEGSKMYKVTGSSIINDLNAKMADFKMSIDLRGKRPDEAKEDLSKYIDQAILLRVKEVKILHGKGNGVLRTVVHEYLNENPEVLRVEDEKPDRGGTGITLVYLH